MSDDDAQRQHAARAREHAGSSQVHQATRKDIEAALREIGINLDRWESVEDFRRTLAFAKDVREVDDFWELLNYMRDQKRLKHEIGADARRGIITVIGSAVTAFLMGAVAAFAALRGGPHP